MVVELILYGLTRLLGFIPYLGAIIGTLFIGSLSAILNARAVALIYGESLEIE